MGWKEKQKKLQERVEDYIFELEDEFNLGIDTFPEVYYLNRNTMFNSLGLNNTYKENFLDIKRGYFEAVQLERPGVILVRGDGIGLGEEAMHFYHHKSAKITYFKKNVNERGAVVILKEMLGYFGSLLLGEERKNPYNQIPDPYLKKKEFKEFCKLNSDWVNGNPENFMNHLMHKLGYDLGICLYSSYSTGNFSRRRIKNLLTNDFSIENSSCEMFLKLRRELGMVKS